MAADFININTAKPLGAKVVILANNLRALREPCDLLMDAVDHSNDGATYTLLETNFGLSGGGANFATLLGNLRDVLNTDVTIAGATRLANVDEFCARIVGQ